MYECMCVWRVVQQVFVVKNVVCLVVLCCCVVYAQAGLTPRLPPIHTYKVCKKQRPGQSNIDSIQVRKVFVLSQRAIRIQIYVE